MKYLPRENIMYTICNILVGLILFYWVFRSVFFMTGPSLKPQQHPNSPFNGGMHMGPSLRRGWPSIACGWNPQGNSISCTATTWWRLNGVGVDTAEGLVWPTWMSRWKLGSMVNKWGYQLLIKGVYWGYNPLTNHLLNFLGHPSKRDHWKILTMINYCTSYSPLCVHGKVLRIQLKKPSEQQYQLFF